jgi:endonuclease/exonuclease/phosphatase family metal-dependent hydrolase
MKVIKVILLILEASGSFGFFSSVYGQQKSNPVIYFSFNGSIKGRSAYSITSTVNGNPSFSQGIDGESLNLSASSNSRKRVIVNTKNSLSFDADQSFSVQVWVRTQPRVHQVHAILSTKKGLAPQDTGWVIKSTKLGSWKWNIGDGKDSYTYQPTANRQPINDGHWHQLIFTINRNRGEARMYYDGLNVAIYNINSIGTLGKESLNIGASATSDRAEWDTFDGWIDEVAIWDRVLSAKEIIETYEMLRPSYHKAHNCSISKLKIMQWNIWHGGHEEGQEVGVNRIISLIKQANPDIISMVETYGSGAKIADALGYYFYRRSSNLSILSRYPIGKTYPNLFKAFKAGGAYIKLPGGQRIAFLTLWLGPPPLYLFQVKKSKLNVDSLIVADKRTHGKEIYKILQHIKLKINQSNQTPVIIAGDFNSGSSLDWIPQAASLHNGYVIEWSASQALLTVGFKDTYRTIHPDPVHNPGFTWPLPLQRPLLSKKTSKDRLDYIYYKGTKLVPIISKVIKRSKIKFPSDHAAVTTTFKLKN